MHKAHFHGTSPLLVWLARPFMQNISARANACTRKEKRVWEITIPHGGS